MVKHLSYQKIQLFRPPSLNLSISLPFSLSLSFPLSFPLSVYFTLVDAHFFSHLERYLSFALSVIKFLNLLFEHFNATSEKVQIK